MGKWDNPPVETIMIIIKRLRKKNLVAISQFNSNWFRIANSVLYNSAKIDVQDGRQRIKKMPLLSSNNPDVYLKNLPFRDAFRAVSEGKFDSPRGKTKEDNPSYKSM